jgi:hypothetical protein
LREALHLEALAQPVLAAEQRVDDLGRVVGPLRQRAQRQRLRPFLGKQPYGDVEQPAPCHGVPLGAGELVVDTGISRVHG